MAWKNGRSVADNDREEIGPRRSALRNALATTSLPRVLLPDSPVGRRRIADGFFSSDVLISKVASGAFTSTVLSALFSAGSFAANKAVRALFASGFVSSDLIDAGAVTKTKLAGGFLKHAVLTGSTAGSFKLTGIDVGDELIHVYEQDGVSGLITDRTSEFKILSNNYISNAAGTNTTDDKLLVLYLDLT